MVPVAGLMLYGMRGQQESRCGGVAGLMLYGMRGLRVAGLMLYGMRGVRALKGRWLDISVITHHIMAICLHTWGSLPRDLGQGLLEMLTGWGASEEGGNGAHVVLLASESFDLVRQEGSVEYEDIAWEERYRES